MKHSFFRKLTALLLGTIMVFSMIPAIAIGTHAAELDLTLSNGTLQAGDKVVIATAEDTPRGVTGFNGTKDATLGTDQGEWVQYTVEIADGGYYFKDESADNYIALPTTNEFKYGAKGIMTVDSDGHFGSNSRYLQINSTYVRFYNSNSKYTQFYVYVVNVAAEHEHVDADNNCACDVEGCTETFEHVDEVADCKCDKCDELLEHNYVNGICSVCGNEIDRYVLVTDTSNLKAGDSIIILGRKDETSPYYALGTTQNTNNRNQVEIEVNNNVAQIAEGMQVLTLETGTVDGTLAFNTGGGYLYAASSSGNHLKTKAELDDNGSWRIAIDSTTGVATVLAQGSNTRNDLRYNSTSGLFACYGEGNTQKEIYIYKFVETPVFNSYRVILNEGVTVSVKFTISKEWIDATPGAKVTFSNETVYDLVAGESEYTTTLTPGQIGTELTVSLGGITKNVSVSTYIARVKEAYASDTTLCDLLDAITAYGNAAARLEQTLTAPDFTELQIYDLDQTESVITGFADVTLGEYANVGLTINAKEGYTYVATLGDATTGKRTLADDLNEGVLLIENLRPTSFNDNITVTIYEGETVVSTITFSFNSYLMMAYDQATTDLDRNVVTAAYNYGLAAEAYITAHAE